MKNAGSILSIIAVSALSALAAHAGERILPTSSWVTVPAGDFTPLFGLDKGQTSFPIQTFRIDIFPVVEKDFQAFLKKYPEWSKSKILSIYTDSKYLEPRKGSRNPQKTPQVFVSWYAAQAYCESKHGRLPTTLEWEYVAAASSTQANALRDPEFVEQILSWYSKPSIKPKDLEIGKKPKNFYGVSDMIGLNWEWTSDFNSFFVAADNREDGDKNKNMFCGNGAIGAANREDYAAFMRYAFRSSMSAHYSVGTLGFRCAYEPEKN